MGRFLYRVFGPSFGPRGMADGGQGFCSGGGDDPAPVRVEDPRTPVAAGVYQFDLLDPPPYQAGEGRDQSLCQGLWRYPDFTLAIAVLLCGGSDPHGPQSEIRSKTAAAGDEGSIQTSQAAARTTPLAPLRQTPVVPTAAEERFKKPYPNCGKTGHTLWGCREPKRCLK